MRDAVDTARPQTGAFAAAALFAFAPLWPAITDAHAGLRVGAAVLAALALLQALLQIGRATHARTAFDAVLWSTVAAATTAWLLLAWTGLRPPEVAVLTLLVANAAWWQAALTEPSTIRRFAFSAGLALVPVIAGLLRTAAALLADTANAVCNGAAVWLQSPPGLLVAAALVLAAVRTFHASPAAAPQRNTTAP